MNLALFIAGRITFKSKRTFSKLIVRIAIAGIMMGLAVMILAVAIVKGFKTEIREKVRGFSADMQIVKFDLNTSYENSPYRLSPVTLEKIRSVPGVTHVQMVASKAGIINANDEVEGVVLKGVGPDYSWDYFRSNLVSGRVIDFTDSSRSLTEIMISQLTANRLKLKVGDSFLMYFVQEPLRKRKFKITGIYRTGIEELDKTYVIGDIALIRRLNNWKPDEIGGAEIRVDDFNRLEETALKVSDEIEFNLRIRPVTQDNPAIFEWLSLLDVNTRVILVLMLAVAVINMISALLIMILERTSMIGVLKALGTSDWSIRKVFLYSAAWLIGLGLLLGNLLAIGLGLFQHTTRTFTLDQSSYYISFIPVQLDLVDIMLLNAGTLMICVLVLLLPSMLVSRITPVKAIAFK